MELNVEKEKKKEMINARPPPPPRTPKHTSIYNCIFIVDESYQGGEGELKLSVGDEIKLRGIPEYGWCEGESKDGTIGWFPISVCKTLLEIIQKEDSETISIVDSTSIISKKEKITYTMNKAIENRPSARLLQEKNIISTNLEDISSILTQELEKKSKADFLNSHLNGQVNSRVPCQLFDFSQSEKSFTESTCTTETNFIYESDDDGDEKTLDLTDYEHMSKPLLASKPSKIISIMLEQNNIPKEPKQIANFLFHSTNIDRGIIGQYLGDKNELNNKVLDEFVGLINFKGFEFDESLRKFLLTFKLPGEAQQIDRIMEGFAKRYFSQYTGSLFANQDTVFLLSFALIMLNTDLHNPSIKKKMTLEEFIKNQRGNNGGKDFPRVYLEDLYQRIKEDKIQMEDVLFPNALKRGFLFREKYPKYYQKLWCILDIPSHSLYCFKNETTKKAILQYDIQNLVIERQKTKKEKRKQKFYPIMLTFKDEKVKFFASSQRIWVDWLTSLNESISLRNSASFQDNNNNNNSNVNVSPTEVNKSPRKKDKDKLSKPATKTKSIKISKKATKEK